MGALSVGSVKDSRCVGKMLDRSPEGGARTPREQTSQSSLRELCGKVCNNHHFCSLSGPSVHLPGSLGVPIPISETLVNSQEFVQWYMVDQRCCVVVLIIHIPLQFTYVKG